MERIEVKDFPKVSKYIFSDGLYPGLEALAFMYPEGYQAPENLTKDQAMVVAQLTAAYVARGLSETVFDPDDVDGMHQRDGAITKLREICGEDVKLIVGLTKMALETAMESVNSVLDYREHSVRLNK